MNALLREALAALARGWSVLPVYAGTELDKNPHATLLIRTGYARWDEQLARNVATWKPLQEEAPSELTVRTWFARERDVGLALVTGRRSGRVVIDFDGDGGRRLVAELGVRPHVRTGGGYHLHVEAPAHRVANIVGKNTKRPGVPECLDVRGDGGNAVLPPTETRKGLYVYLRDPDDLDPITAVPQDLREALGLVAPLADAAPTYTGPLPSRGDRVDAQRILDWALGRLGQGEGRNDAGYRLAWVLFNNGYTEDEVLGVGRQFIAQVDRGTHPYTLEEFRASLRSAARAPRGEPWGRPAQDGVRDVEVASRSRAAVTPEHALQEVWGDLGAEDRTRAAYLLARAAAERGTPLEDTVRLLRLIGHAGNREARAGYEDHERGEATRGTLTTFLQHRGVRLRGGA